MMTTAPVLHPASAAAYLRTAEAHERASAVLGLRRPAAARRHAETASGLRARASRST